MNDIRHKEIRVDADDIDRAWETFCERAKHEPSETAALWQRPIPAARERKDSPPARTAPIGDFAAPVGLPAAAAVSRRGARRRGKGLVAASAAIIAVALLFSPWGGDALAQLQRTFQAKQIATVPLSQEEMNSLRQSLSQGLSGERSFGLANFGEIEQRGQGEARKVSAAEAAALAGRPLAQLPGAAAAEYMYEPPQELTFKLHADDINTMIKWLGGKSVLPAGMDGQPITVRLPGAFGWKPAETGKRLLQFPSPALEVPEGVDADAIRQVVLDLPVIPQSIRDKLAAIGDWWTTLPLPAASNLTRAVTFAGQDAVLHATDDGRSLLWIRDGWVYMLSGTSVAYPTDQAILGEAEGLIRP